MAIPLNDNIKINAPKPSDPRYFAPDNTPWASVVAVEAGIPLTERYDNLPVSIMGVEYWWKDGAWVIYKPTPSLQTVLNVGNESTTNIILQTTDTIAIETYSENNIGIYGSSNDSIGVLGNSGESVGVQGYSLNNIASVFNLGPSNTNNITEWRKANQKVAWISYDGKFTAKKSIKIDSDEPLDAKYLNGKVAYSSLEEANTLIPIGIRSPYLTIVVQGAEYWWADGAWGIKKDTYISVTKAELDTLIANNGLETGFPYKITGVHTSLYGGTTIYSKAIDRNKIEINAIGTFYTPKYDAGSGSGIWTGYVECGVTGIVGLFDNNELITANNGATGQLFGNVNGGFITPLTGSWSGATSITGNASGATAVISNVSVPLTYAIGAKTIWGGYHWTNLTGNLGSKVDDLNLDSTNWSKIAFNSTDYNISYDEITYDYANDFISGRKDDLGNDMSFTFEDFNFIGQHAISYFMWGNSNVKRNKLEGAFVNILNFRGAEIGYTTFEQGSFIQFTTFGQGSFIQYTTFGQGSSISNTTFEQGSSISNTTTFGQGSFIQYTTFEQGSFIENTTFGQGSFIQYTTFEQGSGISNTTTFGQGSGISNTTFEQGSFIQYTTIPPNKSIQFANFEPNASIDNVSLTTSIEIFATYPKTVFRRPDGVSKLRYYNNNNVLVIADIND